VPAGGENMGLGNFALPAPQAGHWYFALESDHSLSAGDPDRLYRADTGGPIPMGKCHHLSKFGFFGIPVSSWTGRYIYMVNENNSLFRQAVTGELWSSGAFPPGRDAIPVEYRHWPDDETLKRTCSHAGC
jgi:hypothetical protein